MPANHSGGIVHFWAGKYGTLAHLYSVGKGNARGPYPWIPYALDNGAFPAFTAGKPWSSDAYRALLAWAAFAPIAPTWALVPDVVGDRAATLESWKRWAPIVSQLGVPLAFAAQDGMTPTDVPREAAVLFVGGSTAWKMASLPAWCDAFPRVHVGRINGYAGLVRCAAFGVESCDGTGWFHGDAKQLAGLARFLQEQHDGQHRSRHRFPAAVAAPATRAALHSHVL